MSLALAWLLPALCALFGSVVLCRLAMRYAVACGFLDRPGVEAHKQHARTVPYGGGPAMALALTLALGLAVWLWPLPGYGLLPWPLLAGAAWLVIVGLADDARPLSPRLKLALQAVVCAGAVSFADLSIDFLHAWSPIIAWITAFLWLILVTNAYNLLDHADGLSGAIAAVAFFALAGGAALSGDLGAARVWVCVGVALLGFLVWNRPPARLYMGDAGSLAIGFLIGCGTLSTTFWPSADGGSPLALLSPLLICAIPLFDTGAVVVKRLRRGKPIMQGDRNHISHRLTRLGVGARASLGAVIALQIALAAASFQLRNADWMSGVVALAQAAAICVALVLLETSRDHG